MKTKRSLYKFFTLLMLLSTCVFSQPVYHFVKYNRKNLILAQKHDPKKKSTYAYTVTINGVEHELACIDDTVTINFSLLGFKMGDSLDVKLQAAAPGLRIVDTVAFPVYTKFDCRNLFVDISDTTLHWTTKGEEGPTYYAIEQYRWQHWVYLETVRSKGNADSSFGFLKVKKYLHNGENKFRISVQGMRKKNVGPNATINDTCSLDLDVKYRGTRNRPIKFVRPTVYEMYDHYGNKLRYGFGPMIYTNQLKPGAYYLNFENKTTEYYIY